MANKIVRHEHREVVKRDPWVCDNWKLWTVHVNHWQNMKTPSWLGYYWPKHTWSFRIGTSFRLDIKYGCAPKG